MASDANVEVAVQLSDEVRDDGIALECGSASLPLPTVIFITPPIGDSCQQSTSCSFFRNDGGK
jgi:hypothetical protein